MKAHKIQLLAALMLASTTAPAMADEVEEYLGNGAPGLPTQTEDPGVFRVCAPKDNLPFSNEAGEGYENKIAEVLAKDLGKKLQYFFWYDRQGFYRNSLNAHRCDVVIGTASDVDMTLNSKPYYRSGYAFVYKKSSGYNIKDYDAPDLHKAKIGVIMESPPTRPLFDKGLLDNSRPYRMQRDLNLPPSFLIDDLVKGDIDVAIVWGPIAGYFAKQAKEELVVNLAPEYEAENPHGKEYWNISVGVRKKEKDRIAMINEALERHKDDINKILDDYGIPHVPVVETKKQANR
jgi:mxaJ protein